jgi:superfamily II DNA or RNA helicase
LPLIVNVDVRFSKEETVPKEASYSRYSMPNVELYAWQQECLSRWFENGCRGVAGVATGAGKTLLALAAVYHLAARNPAGSLKIKIIVPKVFLAAQWRADIMKFLGTARSDIGLYYGAVKEAGEKPFMIYVLNTARLCVSRHILKDVSEGASVLLICDECHHFASTENAHVFDFFPHIPQERFFSLGLSATPNDEADNDTPIPALGKEIYRYGLSEAVRDSIIADCALFHVAVNFTECERKEYDEFSEKITRLTRNLMQKCPALKGMPHKMFLQKLKRMQKSADEPGDLARVLLQLFFRRKEIVHKAQMRIDCGTEIIRRLMPDHRTILFSERIETADILFDTLRETFPGRIDRYHSNMDTSEKARALRRYRNGESNVIVCCRALDEGLNVPETDAGVILSVSSGARQRIQRVGRVLRRDPAGRPKKIFYLYIPESSEADKLLPTEGAAHDMFASGTNVYSLGWIEPGCLQPDHEYSVLAEKVTAHLIRSGASEQQLLNAAALLDRGSVRTDFLLPESVCSARFERARADEKDYFAVMLLMARARTCGAEAEVL